MANEKDQSGNGNKYGRMLKNPELIAAGKTESQKEILERGGRSDKQNIKEIVKQGTKDKEK